MLTRMTGISEIFMFSLMLIYETSYCILLIGLCLFVNSTTRIDLQDNPATWGSRAEF